MEALLRCLEEPFEEPYKALQVRLTGFISALRITGGFYKRLTCSQCAAYNLFGILEGPYKEVSAFFKHVVD